MRTKDELFRAAQREIAARRQHAVMQAETARRAAYAANPALSVSPMMPRCGQGFRRARHPRLRGGDMDAALRSLSRFRLTRPLPRPPRPPVSGARKPLPPSSAARCARTPGMRGGVPCSCVADVARRLRREEINAASPLGLCQFSTFDVNRYPDTPVPEFGVTARAYMTKLLELSKNYAAKFNSKSKNLLFMGRSGLGKTPLGAGHC